MQMRVDNEGVRTIKLNATETNRFRAFNMVVGEDVQQPIDGATEASAGMVKVQNGVELTEKENVKTAAGGQPSSR